MKAFTEWLDGPEYSPTRLLVFRFLFFGILAFDTWLLKTEHIPRFGAAGFNVPEARFLEIFPVPTPGVVGPLYLLAGFFALRTAIGASALVSAVGTCVLYGGIYAWSQSDSYQHHYLIALMLFVACFLPFDRIRLPSARASDGPPARVRAPALRFMYLQVALLYFWAGIAKVDPIWMDGSTLRELMRAAPDVAATMVNVGAALGISADGMYALSAQGTVWAEFVLALVFVMPRFWYVGLLIGPPLHIMIEVVGLDIGWFSYFMLLLNFGMLLPESVFDRVGDILARVRARLPDLTPMMERAGDLGPTLVAAAICGLLAAQIPIEGGELLLGLLVVVPAAELLRKSNAAERTYVAVGSVLAAGLLTTSLLTSSVLYDYYRFWGGDLFRRGQAEASVEKYEMANALADGPARHYKLARVLDRLGRLDDAEIAIEAGIARHREAIDAARRDLRRDPYDAERRFDVGELNTDLAIRLRWAARLYPRLGDNDAAAEAREAADAAQRAAISAFEKGLETQPGSRRGRQGLGRARARR